MAIIIHKVLYVFTIVTLAGYVTVSYADSQQILEGMYVRIGGIEQWITIKSEDRNNPVVLFLHGGPGSAQSPVADSWYPDWDRDFTLVQWDQRDSGRTFIKNGESIEPTITLERMTRDGIEVAEFLKEYLQRKKIIITGSSWGSVLGVRMAHERPDLFYAYVGLAQVTNWQEDLAASYTKVREIAQSKSDRKIIDTLNEIGPLPWGSADDYLSFMRVLHPYQAELATSPPPSFAVSGEYSQEAKEYGLKNREFTFRYIWRLLNSINITSLTDFKIPVFMIHGEADLTVPLEVTRAYFDEISAPRKEFYLVPGTGHNPSLAELEKLREVLLSEVRPISIH